MRKMITPTPHNLTNPTEDIKHMGTDASKAVPGPTKLPFLIARILMIYLYTDTLHCPFFVLEPV